MEAKGNLMAAEQFYIGTTFLRRDPSGRLALLSHSPTRLQGFHSVVPGRAKFRGRLLTVCGSTASMRSVTDLSVNHIRRPRKHA